MRGTDEEYAQVTAQQLPELLLRVAVPRVTTINGSLDEGVSDSEDAVESDEKDTETITIEITIEGVLLSVNIIMKSQLCCLHTQ